jgi:hypothetical protein
MRPLEGDALGFPMIHRHPKLANASMSYSQKYRPGIEIFPTVSNHPHHSHLGIQNRAILLVGH